MRQKQRQSNNFRPQFTDEEAMTAYGFPKRPGDQAFAYLPLWQLLIRIKMTIQYAGDAMILPR
ncbi:MAG: hypothetical protein LBU67_03185 [Oscillospiraceae bacterium]|jgi:hypothetical protein|nr:hypothetical protein [Oscillospiraceae bacterium]